LAINSYRHSFFHPEKLADHGVKLASARAGNVIGGGDFTPDALVVDAVHALSQHKPVRVRNPSAIRPWNHVLQVLDGYLHLIARMLESDDQTLLSGWNFGPLPGNEFPTRQVVEMLIDEWGGGCWADASDPNQLYESQILRLSIDKAMWQIGWRPRWSLSRSIQETVRWYRAYFAGGHDLAEVGRRQIELFEIAQTAGGPIVSPPADRHVLLSTNT
jgi:CDP-glucose 4,6-dehydratase